MRPLILKISAFGPYAGNTVIPMEDLGTKGLYLITGDTGAGKTTIFDAICYALFGEASGDSRDTSMLRSKYAEVDTPTEVDLTFLHGGKEYRVVRNPEYERPAKRGDGFTKQVANACLYLPDGKTITKQKDVTEEIENILGINRNQFSQIAMIAQGDFRKLLLADTKQRQEIFRELFKTGYYQKLQSEIEIKRKEICGIVEDGKKSVNQYIAGIEFDENDVTAIDVANAKKGLLTAEEIIELIEKILVQDNNTKEKIDAELISIGKELEKVNETIGAAETVQKAKSALEAATSKLSETLPQEEQLTNAYKQAKEDLCKKDSYTNEAAVISAELEKYDSIQKIQAEILRTEEQISTDEAFLVSNDNKKEVTERTLEQLRVELDSIKDVAVNLEKLKNDYGKANDNCKAADELIKDYKDCSIEKELLEEAQRKYADDNNVFINLQHIYESKEQAFRDGQAGVLASTLSDGKPCPVCGSTSHPAKAHMTDSIPTENELKLAKGDAEQARNKANESSNEAGKRKTSLTLKEENLYQKAKKVLDFDDISNLNEIISDNKSKANKEVEDLLAKIKDEENKLKRKIEIEDSLPKHENELKAIQDASVTVKEKLSGAKTKLDENKKQVEELLGSITFDNRSEAEEKKNELLNNAKRIQTNYDKADFELKEVSQKIVALKSEIESCNNTIAGAAEANIEEIKAKKTDLETNQSECIKNIGIVGTRISTNTSVLANIKKQSGKIAETEKKLQWVSALADTANGKLRGKEKIMLETYIQATYFDRIINRANLRLMKMSGGQYELKRKNEADNTRSQSGLELNVIDHYNGTERSVKTLSGGESFMASLSLALGLSDEVQSSAGGIKVDTMFVDEGFGSLDSDALDQAYRALASLTEGNRLVGIISHVSELKSKIDRQVVVKKEKSGGSFVSLILQ